MPGPANSAIHEKQRSHLTAGASRLFTHQPCLHAINDIIVGIDESRLLRWLVRNCQKAGIEEHYEEEMNEAEAAESSRRD